MTTFSVNAAGAAGVIATTFIAPADRPGMPLAVDVGLAAADEPCRTAGRRTAANLETTRQTQDHPPEEAPASPKRPLAQPMALRPAPRES